MWFTKKIKNYPAAKVAELTKALIYVLQQVAHLLADSSSTGWTALDNTKEVQTEIADFITHIEHGDLSSLDELSIRFAPTGNYQELSIANDWQDAYLKLSKEVDTIEFGLKNFI